MRTLPLRLSPVDGESLPGYVMRYSHSFGLAPGDVVRALGLDSGAGPITAAGRYGVSLSAEQLRHAAFAIGIGTERLERMLLARYAGRAFDRSIITAPVALIGAAQPHGMLIWSSRFCPLCLRDDGAWRLRWQLACNVVCLRHACCSCGPAQNATPSRKQGCARRAIGAACWWPRPDTREPPSPATAATLPTSTTDTYNCATSTRSGGRRVNRLGYGRCQGPAASGEGVGWPACQALAAWIR